MTQRSMFDNDQVKIVAESTHIVLELDGVECRVWNATTESGEQCFLFVHRVATRAELAELIKKPDPLTMEIPRGYTV
jgi:hypothetical protein